MAEDKKITREEANIRLITKAWKDKSFYKLLMENPKSAIEQELSIKFAEGVEVIVHESTPEKMHFVLPAKPKVMPSEADVEGQGIISREFGSGGPSCCIYY